MSLREAQDCLHIEPESRGAIRAMARKIPDTQHDSFTVVLDNRPGSETYRGILTVSLTADEAMKEMNKLYAKAEMTPVQLNHGLNRAIHHERGEPLGILIRDGTTSHEHDRTKDYRDHVYVEADSADSENPYITAKDFYSKKGIKFEGSYMLDTARSMPNLSKTAKDKLDRVSKFLEKGVHDAFTVDLAMNDEGACDVISLAITPNVLGIITGIPLRYHRKTMELNAEQFDLAVSKIGRSGQQVG